MATARPPHITTRALIVGAALTLTMSLASCSGDDAAHDSPSEDDASGGQPAEGDPGSGTLDPTIDTAPTTAAPQPLPEGTAGDVTAELQQHIALQPAEAACVADTLDDKTLSELADGIDTTSDAYTSASEVAANCIAAVTYIPQLVDSITAQLGATPEQATCLTNTLNELNAEQLTTLSLTGKLDDDTTGRTILDDCGIE